MGFLLNRVVVLASYFDERWRYGRPVELDRAAPQTVFLLDGVGGWSFAPLMMRRALRRTGARMHTVRFDWHGPVPGDLLTDLTHAHKNRVMAARLARRIRALKREEPARRVHIVAYSGGCGVAVMALPYLDEKSAVERVILLAPAVSPAYPLAPVLRHVGRCIAGVSLRDRFLLGVGTRWFGTIDRVRTDSAGRVGFTSAPDASEEERNACARVEQFRWTHAWRARGHHGGHTAWIHPRFMREEVLTWLLAPDAPQGD